MTGPFGGIHLSTYSKIICITNVDIVVKNEESLMEFNILAKIIRNKIYLVDALIILINFEEFLTITNKSLLVCPSTPIS